MEIQFTAERVVPGRTPYGMLQEHIGRYIFASNFVRPNDIVLDIACGTGYGTSYLAQKASKVIGGDIDEQCIRYAHSLYSKDRTAFVTLDCIQLPFPELCFDVIVSIETIEHLQYDESFLKECQRVMKKGGMFICTTPNRVMFSPKGLNPHGYHVKEFDPGELNELLRKHWDDVRIHGQCCFSRAELGMRLAKQHVFTIAGRCLSSIPKGERVKELVKRQLIPELGTPLWKEISGDMLNKRYMVVPLQSIENAGCMFLSAVARGPLSKSSEAL